MPNESKFCLGGSAQSKKKKKKSYYQLEAPDALVCVRLVLCKVLLHQLHLILQRKCSQTVRSLLVPASNKKLDI